MKDPFPCGLCAGVVYKFLCAGCSVCDVGETTRHFSTRVREHMLSDRRQTFSGLDDFSPKEAPLRVKNQPVQKNALIHR